MNSPANKKLQKWILTETLIYIAVIIGLSFVWPTVAFVLSIWALIDVGLSMRLLYRRKNRLTI